MNDLVTAAEAPEICSQAEFARQQKWSKSYVTKLKLEGRLVMTAGDKVDVQASLQKIRETTGAPERAAPAVQGPSYAAAADLDKHYTGQLKKLEFEKAIGKVLDRDEQMTALADAAVTLRANLETWPERLSPQIAALSGDEARIRACLAEHIEAALTEISQRFQAMATQAS